ncbi:MAG: hypothetical protein IH985_05845 [Planctomycetes bacterium]|nr:hypothetical protein [Planctomycetota bacterium]
MSVLTRFTRALGETVKFRPAPQSSRRRKGSYARGVAASRPERAVQVESPSNGHAASGEIERKRVGRQEMIAELQQNYQDVIRLVGKVNGHLDEQEKRAVRLLEIAELVPAAADQIPALNEHLARATATLAEIAEDGKAANRRADAAIRSQTQMLEALGDRLISAEESDRRVAGTLGDLNLTIGSMTGATDQLAGVIRSVQHRDAQRDEQMRALLTRFQRWLLIALVVCGASVAASLAIALWG